MFILLLHKWFNMFYIHTAVGCAVVRDYTKKQKMQAEYDLHLWNRKNSLLHQKLD